MHATAQYRRFNHTLVYTRAGQAIMGAFASFVMIIIGVGVFIYAQRTKARWNEDLHHVQEVSCLSYHISKYYYAVPTCQIASRDRHT
jgi:hypothetical protein